MMDTGREATSSAEPAPKRAKEGDSSAHPQPSESESSDLSTSSMPKLTLRPGADLDALDKGFFGKWPDNNKAGAFDSFRLISKAAQQSQKTGGNVVCVHQHAKMKRKDGKVGICGRFLITKPSKTGSFNTSQLTRHLAEVHGVLTATAEKKHMQRKISVSAPEDKKYISHRQRGKGKQRTLSTFSGPQAGKDEMLRVQMLRRPTSHLCSPPSFVG